MFAGTLLLKMNRDINEGGYKLPPNLWAREICFVPEKVFPRQRAGSRSSNNPYVLVHTTMTVNKAEHKWHHSHQVMQAN